ncbi:hypothetical protein MtrunA17_Chr3g0105741 [Medicago truncatula]|uniref:Uncharacterized protein n=1 Tax=Medicago truncatula TaxID=3880 RepID=A0A396IPX1_MEDTR|nr:hypothetical protein MtrunA17_Chr3g0105741 [Medicago truncatula]
MLQLEQQRPKNSNKVVRPFSHGPSSSFRPWQPSWKNDIGKQEASSSGVKATPQDNNNLNIEKSNLGYIEKNHMNGGRATTEKIQNLTMKTVGTDMVQLEEQLRHTKSNIVVRPFSHSASSTFRPWKPSWNNDFAKQEASNNGVKLPTQIHNSKLNIEKSNLGHIEKNQFSRGGIIAGELFFLLQIIG